MENRDEQTKMAVVDLNEVKTLMTIFDKDPECGWGLRGDAYLWNLLRAKMGSDVPPSTAEEFVRTVRFFTGEYAIIRSVQDIQKSSRGR